MWRRGLIPRNRPRSLNPMPELPEVETIRRQLAPALEGRTLQPHRDPDPRWCEPLAPDAISDAVAKRRIDAVVAARQVPHRRDGRRRPPAHPPAHDRHAAAGPATSSRAYERVRLHFEGRRIVHFCDPRRFGTGELALGADALTAFLDARLGIEPLSDEFTGAACGR